MYFQKPYFFLIPNIRVFLSAIWSSIWNQGAILQIIYSKMKAVIQYRIGESMEYFSSRRFPKQICS